MAVYNKLVLTDTFEAGEDLSAARYCAVAFSAGKVVKCDGTTVPIGILQNAPGSGGEALVQMMGITPAYVDGGTVNVAAGDLLTVDSNGHLVKAVSLGAKIIGIALEAATANNKLINVLVNPMGNLSQVVPTSFLTLPDTPSSYSGKGGYYVKVNSTATGLEFAAS